MNSKNKFDEKQIGGRLKAVRKKLGLTLGQIRDATGASTSGVSEMESGIKKPSSVYMFSLCELYNVNVNWVLTGRGTMFNTGIELELDFGMDNEIIKELIACIQNVDLVRFDMLRYFVGLKKESPWVVEESKKKK